MVLGKAFIADQADSFAATTPSQVERFPDDGNAHITR